MCMPAFLGYTLIILISTMCVGMLISIIPLYLGLGATVQNSMIICVGMLIETVVPLYKILLGHDKLYV